MKWSSKIRYISYFYEIDEDFVLNRSDLAKAYADRIFKIIESNNGKTFSYFNFLKTSKIFA